MREDLWAAYHSTRFEADTPVGTVVILVGEKHPGLDELLERHGRHCWCFITAWNPGSFVLTEAENERRNRSLRDEIEATAEWGPIFEGVGRPMEDNWQPEPSFLVLGIDGDQAVRLGQRHGQNIVVWGALGNAARLVNCRSETTTCDRPASRDSEGEGQDMGAVGLNEDDRELLLDAVLEQGQLVAEQIWDSGGPGAGAGEVSVYEYRGEFYLFDDVGMHGPFERKADAKEQGQIDEINEATRVIWDEETGTTFTREPVAADEAPTETESERREREAEMDRLTKGKSGISGGSDFM